jgi:hypothetical protein
MDRVLSAENQTARAFPLLSTEIQHSGLIKIGGRSSVVEFQPSKLAVRGSNPLARSSFVRPFIVERYSFNVREA